MLRRHLATPPASLYLHRRLPNRVLSSQFLNLESVRTQSKSGPSTVDGGRQAAGRRETSDGRHELDMGTRCREDEGLGCGGICRTFVEKSWWSDIYRRCGFLRLLTTPTDHVFVIATDSITQQHYYALNYALNQANIVFDANHPSLPLFDHENVNQHTLKKDNPITQRLLERAGVPASRLDRPITTMLEDDMLIHEQDIRAITGRLGAKKEYNWTMDVQRVEGWVEFVRNASRPRRGEEDTITEDTVLLMNAGAHVTISPQFLYFCSLPLFLVV